MEQLSNKVLGDDKNITKTIVYIDTGKASFTVNSTKKNLNDFKVYTPASTASVRGTAFDYELIDNAGEFGRICDWSTSNRTYVSNWITNNQDKIHHIIDLYFGQFNKDDVDISEEIQDVFEWINNKLICEVDKAILKYPWEQVQLLSDLPALL